MIKNFTSVFSLLISSILMLTVFIVGSANVLAQSLFSQDIKLTYERDCDTPVTKKYQKYFVKVEIIRSNPENLSYWDSANAKVCAMAQNQTHSI